MRLKWKLFRIEDRIAALENPINNPIEDRIAALENRINNAALREDIVCEVCGCVLPCYAFKGKGEIRQKKEYNPFFPLYGLSITDYVYYPRYCKIHIPKTSDPIQDTPQDGQCDQLDRK